MFDMYKWITNAEKTILVFIALFTIYGISTIDLIYESGAVLLLSLSALVIRWNLVQVRRDPSQPQSDE